MKIDQSNYEIFFLDYLDGNLSDVQIDEFLDFLKTNPELRKELKSVSDIKLSSENISFPLKDDLLKGDHINNSFDYLAIAFMDGQLSDEDQKIFVDELDSDPKKEHEFDLILSTKLKKETIQYPYKEKLYRKSKIKFLYWISRVAAVIVLLMATWVIFHQEHNRVPEPVFSESLTPILKSEQNILEQKQEPVTKKKPIEKITETKSDSIPKKTKSIREKTKGRLKEVASSQQFVRPGSPEKISSISAHIKTDPSSLQYVLMTIKEKPIPKQVESISLDKYLAQKIFKKRKQNSDDNLASRGLKTVSDWSNEKLDYKTDEQGNISEFSIRTGLLAFSIPVSKNK